MIIFRLPRIIYRRLLGAIMVAGVMSGCVADDRFEEGTRDNFEQFVDSHFFEDGAAPYRFVFEKPSSARYDLCLPKDDVSYPGYAIYRAMGDVPFQPKYEESSSDCRFQYLSASDKMFVKRLNGKRLKYKNCSIFLENYPNVERVFISATQSVKPKTPGERQYSPAANCYFRIAMAVQGFDRALFMKHDDLFADVSKVAPLEGLFSSKTRTVPKVSNFLYFKCLNINKYYQTKRLRAEIEECLMKTRK